MARDAKPARPAKPPADPPAVIGWKERIDFPDWGLVGVVAKSDTGARTGALDVGEITELPDNRVRFAVRLTRRDGERSDYVEAPISRRSRVRSAFGHAHDRLFIETTIRVGPVSKTVELGLVCRKKMLCRVLLGRKALQDDFVVDSRRRYVLTSKRAMRLLREQQNGVAGPKRKKKKELP